MNFIFFSGAEVCDTVLNTVQGKTLKFESLALFYICQITKSHSLSDLFQSF